MAVTNAVLTKRIMASRAERRTVPPKYWKLYARGERLAADERELRRRGFSTHPGRVGVRISEPTPR